MNHNFIGVIDDFFAKQENNCLVDCHSPIRIVMKNNAIINMDISEEMIVLWAAIADYNMPEIERVARMFDDTRLGFENKTGEVPELNIFDGKIVLSSCIKMENILCIDAFSERISAFSQCNNELMY
ncbi:hypothetical protein SC171_27435 [Pantoea cypripedii]|uniref:hypothetical protein n=1 Tax=Pantoea cypripedii TaxID=55209 RepID=UPI002FCBAB85